MPDGPRKQEAKMITESKSAPLQSLQSASSDARRLGDLNPGWA